VTQKLMGMDFIQSLFRGNKQQAPLAEATGTPLLADPVSLTATFLEASIRTVASF
jgi:hypothetical protein